MKYRAILEIKCDDVSADEIKETLSVDIPDSGDFTFIVVSVSAPEQQTKEMK